MVLCENKIIISLKRAIKCIKSDVINIKITDSPVSRVPSRKSAGLPERGTISSDNSIHENSEKVNTLKEKPAESLRRWSVGKTGRLTESETTSSVTDSPVSRVPRRKSAGLPERGTIDSNISIHESTEKVNT